MADLNLTITKKMTANGKLENALMTEMNTHV